MMNWSFDGVWSLTMYDHGEGTPSLHTMLPASVTSVQLLGKTWIAVLAWWDEIPSRQGVVVNTEKGPEVLDRPTFINPENVAQMEQVMTAHELAAYYESKREEASDEDVEQAESECPMCGAPAEHGKLCVTCLSAYN